MKLETKPYLGRYLGMQGVYIHIFNHVAPNKFPSNQIHIDQF